MACLSRIQVGLCHCGGRFDLTMPKVHNEISPTGDFIIVRHHDDRETFLVQLAQHIKDFISGLFIEISSWFIRK
jgi:hypothetical protein